VKKLIHFEFRSSVPKRAGRAMRPAVSTRSLISPIQSLLIISVIIRITLLIGSG
jgi:hypothetical protein